MSRLTVRQYQNAVADLVGSFRAQNKWGDERGLAARYNPTRNVRDGDKQVRRTDPNIDFDWGTESPVPDKLEAHEFSVRWQGLLLAPDTGDYEFILKTEHAARLWINDMEQPLIDAYVRADSDKEFRGTVRLLGGRAYPLKLEFSKANQGVNDKEKNKDKPKPDGLRTKPVLKLAFFHLFHCVVSSARGEGHVGDGRVLASGGNHERSVGDKQILDVVALIPLV